MTGVVLEGTDIVWITEFGGVLSFVDLGGDEVILGLVTKDDCN